MERSFFFRGSYLCLVGAPGTFGGQEFIVSHSFMACRAWAAGYGRSLVSETT